MATFRCYHLDANDHIQQVEIIDARALGEAVEKGLAMLRRSRYPAIEIWEGATKVFPVSASPCSRCRLLKRPLRATEKDWAERLPAPLAVLRPSQSTGLLREWLARRVWIGAIPVAVRCGCVSTRLQGGDPSAADAQLRVWFRLAISKLSHYPRAGAVTIDRGRFGGGQSNGAPSGTIDAAGGMGEAESYVGGLRARQGRPVRIRAPTTSATQIPRAMMVNRSNGPSMAAYRPVRRRENSEGGRASGGRRRPCRGSAP